jgi:hypothetical protein
MTTEVPTADNLWGNRGAPPEIDPGKVIARPIPIRDIHPDLSQPRRVLPASIRGEFDGDPEDMPEVLGNWHLVVEARLGKPFDLSKALKGNGDGEENEKHADPVVEAYMELTRLAASIHRDGLINPVRVVKYGSGFLIESGERRWAAYWLLSLHIQGDNGQPSPYLRIPAVEKNHLDVWAQAAENGARSPLNAIGMARQLALLVMAMYEKDDGVRFEKYEADEDGGGMVYPGECDRRFYAQVANGQLYRIKKGLLDRVLSVTGLKSMEMVSRYRALLDIPDDLWQEADEEDWTEGEIRKHIQNSKSSVDIADTLTGVKVSPSNTDISTGNNGDQNKDRAVDDSFLPPPAFKVGDKVRDTNGKVGIITMVWNSGIVDIEPIGMRKWESLTRVDDDTEVTPVATLPKGFADLTPDGKPQERVMTSPAAPIDESTSPLVDEWENPQLADILRFLQSITPESSYKTFEDLLTLSRADLRRLQNEIRNPERWREFMEDVAAEVQEAINRHVGEAVSDFLSHAFRLGAAMRDDVIVIEDTERE